MALRKIKTIFNRTTGSNLSNGDEWVTIKTPYEVHYWSFDKKKTFGKKEMREIHYARKKVVDPHHF